MFLPKSFLWALLTTKTIALSPSPSSFPSRIGCEQTRPRGKGKKTTGPSTAPFQPSGCLQGSPVPSLMGTFSPSSKTSTTHSPTLSKSPVMPAVSSSDNPTEDSSSSEIPTTINESFQPSKKSSTHSPTLSKSPVMPAVSSSDKPTEDSSSEIPTTVNESFQPSSTLARTDTPGTGSPSNLSFGASSQPSLDDVARPLRPPSLAPTMKLIEAPLTGHPSNLAFGPSNLPSLYDAGSYLHSPSLAPTGKLVEISSPSFILDTIIERGHECYNSSMGVFGQLTIHDINFQFKYEIEFIEAYIVESILTSLELAISSSLVDALFVPGCARNKRVLNLINSTVIGVSSEPNDLVLKEACKTKSVAKNSCNVIKGRLTVSTNAAPANATITKLELQAVIKKGMQSGLLTESHNGIVKLTYVGKDAEIDLSSEDVKHDDGTSSNTRKKVVPTFVWFVLASGGIIAIGLTGYYWYNEDECLEYGELDGVSSTSIENCIMYE